MSPSSRVERPDDDRSTAPSPATDPAAAPPQAAARPTLALAWLLTGLLVGAVGALVWGLGEQSSDRLLGLVQLGAALLALGMTGRVVSSGSAARRSSRALSLGLLVLAAASALVQVVDGPVFWQDVLLVSLPSAVGAAVTALLARAGR